MPTRLQIQRKDTLLSTMVQVRQDLLAVVATLPAAQQRQVFLGVWSAREVLAHLIGWDETNRKAVKSVLKGQLPAFYKYHDRDWRSYNARLVRKHNQGSFRELLAGAQASQQELVDFLQTIPPEHFSRDFGVRFRGYKVTVQRLLEAEAGDERTHHQQLIRFFRNDAIS